MKSNDWVWYGYPGHFIACDKCQFRLCTEVNGYLVSTVGDYRPNGDGKGMTQIGANRTFETFVFEVTGKRCNTKGCGCNMPSINGHEIDSLGANSPGEAQRNHLTLCAKYSRKKHGRSASQV